MNHTLTWLEKWNQLIDPIRPVLQTVANIWQKIWNVICLIGLWIYRFRALFLAIPVVVAALRIARINYELLPDMVGLELLNNGSFSFMVVKEVAVYAPLAVTALCLLMMILSRKTLYPWLISVFSLVLPLLILVINVFPG